FFQMLSEVRKRERTNPMSAIDPKTFSPFAPEYVEPDRPHGPVNAYGEWEWEMLEMKNGLPKVYATLWRDPYGVAPSPIAGMVNVLTTETTPCPFCRKKHIHGIGDGHRVPHCADRKKKPAATLSDGISVYHQDGYIIRTRKVARP